MSIYGELDTASECLKRVTKQVSEVWAGGEVRYRKGDIERAKKYLKEISKGRKQITDTLKLFESVALSSQEVVLVKKEKSDNL